VGAAMMANSGDPSMDEDSASTICVDNVEPRQPWKLPVIEYFNLKYATTSTTTFNCTSDGTQFIGSIAS
jgi:hypothetical protein